MGERTDRIEAHIAPQLEPDFRADVGEHRCLQPRSDECLRYVIGALGLDAVQLAQRKPVAFERLYDSGRNDFAGGIDDATDDPTRLDVLLDHAVGIGGLEPVARVRALEVLKVPPRQAVLDRHDDGVRGEQRAHLRCHRLYHVSFQRQEDEVLRSRLGAARHGAQILGELFGSVGADELETVAPDRVQMRALIDHRDRLTRECETNGEYSTDRTRADDCNFHFFLLHARSSRAHPCMNVATSMPQSSVRYETRKNRTIYRHSRESGNPVSLVRMPLGPRSVTKMSGDDDPIRSYVKRIGQRPDPIDDD